MENQKELRNFTYYNQADPKWAQQRLQNGEKTIKQKGCPLCCMAMILNIQPDQLNKWLKENKGYIGNFINWSVFTKIGLDYKGKVFGGQILTQFDKQSYLVLKLTGHWVLMRGYKRQIDIYAKKGLIKVQVYDPGHINITEIDFNSISEAVVLKN